MSCDLLLTDQTTMNGVYNKVKSLNLSCCYHFPTKCPVLNLKGKVYPKLILSMFPSAISKSSTLLRKIVCILKQIV